MQNKIMLKEQEGEEISRRKIKGSDKRGQNTDLIQRKYVTIKSKKNFRTIKIRNKDTTTILEPHRSAGSKKKRWKRSDLIILKKEFTRGTRLKVIARILGRTETSVNKELSRSGIRSNENKKMQHFYYSNTIDRCQSCEAKVSAIIEYLESLGYKINIFQQKTDYGYDVIYKLNKVSISFMRLLIIANKHRLENGLSVFRVR